MPTLLLLRDVVVATVGALLIIGTGVTAMLALPPVWGLALAGTLATLVALWARRRHHHDAGAPYALRTPIPPEERQGMSLAVTVLAGWAAVMVAAMLVGLIAPEVEDATGIWAALERYTRSVPGFLALFIFAAVLTPMVEEIAFRGFIQGRIATRTSPGVAVFLTALLFAVVHAGRPHWSYLMVPLALGIAAGSAVHRFRSVWPAVAIHAAWNTTVAAMILLQRFVPQVAPDEVPAVGWLELDALSVRPLEYVQTTEVQHGRKAPNGAEEPEAGPGEDRQGQEDPRDQNRNGDNRTGAGPRRLS